VRRSLLLFAVVTLVAAGCGGGDKSHTAALTATGATPIPTTGTSTSQVAPTRVKHHYPRALQRAFLVNCVKNGGTTATCACTLHRLQERMPVAQFSKVGRALQAKRKPPAALERKFRSTSVLCARSSG
jgi:hypothetical protein